MLYNRYKCYITVICPSLRSRFSVNFVNIGNSIYIYTSFLSHNLKFYDKYKIKKKFKVQSPNHYK